ncbi:MULTISPECIES: sensor histidine kinase [Rahnella]|uniref:sensor histidine kinase n=1 Tax=Rahnella TaxID=34037 RepID=UPI0031345520
MGESLREHYKVVIFLAAFCRGAQFVWLSIEDTGEGISAEHLPLIFDRFYRIDASRSLTENTGLGLAIVKTIAELHGGRIVVESEPGKGSRFTLVLPK